MFFMTCLIHDLCLWLYAGRSGSGTSLLDFTYIWVHLFTWAWQQTERKNRWVMDTFHTTSVFCNIIGIRVFWLRLWQLGRGLPQIPQSRLCIHWYTCSYKTTDTHISNLFVLLVHQLTWRNHFVMFCWKLLSLTIYAWRCWHYLGLWPFCIREAAYWPI